MLELNKRLPVTARIKNYFLVYILFCVLILSLFSAIASREYFLKSFLLYLVLGFFIYALMSLIYSYWFYQLGENSITVYSGIIIKKTKTISFDSISSIEEKRGPLMTLIGISSLKIWTSSPAQITLSKGSSKTRPDIALSFNREDTQDFLSHFHNYKQKKNNA